MTTLPPNYIRLSSKWLETNPLPEDARLLSPHTGRWIEYLAYRGELIPESHRGFLIATARTDLPKEAYADNEIRPMTHEERKVLDEFTMKELTESEPAPDLTQPGLPKADLTQPGAEVVSERADLKNEFAMRVQAESQRDHLADLLKQGREAYTAQSNELATLRAQLEAKEAELQQAREGRAAQESELTKALAAYEDQVQSLEAENDKLRAEVANWRSDAFQSNLKNQETITNLLVELDAVRKERYAVVEKFRKAEEWNKLTELELKNLRSLNSDLSQDIDSIDMLRDEFRRIASCPDATEEIKGLCKRALQDIKQRVPVIKQRDTAIADRDRLAVRVRGLLKTLEPYVKLVDRPKHVCGQYLGLATNSLYAYAVNEFYKAKEAVEKLLTPSQQPDKEAISNDSGGPYLSPDESGVETTSNPSQPAAVTSLQPDNLKGGDEPCAQKEKKSRDSISPQKPGENDSEKTMTGASNPQPESPIPSGVGHHSRPEAVKSGEWLPIDAVAEAGEEVLGYHPEWVHDEFSPAGIRSCIYDGEVWHSSTWRDDDSNILHHNSGQSPMLYRPLPAPPIAPEGKSTEGEG